MSQLYNRRKFLKAGTAIGWGIALGSVARARDGKITPASRGKRVYIMTDMEGVAGVLDSENWCRPEGRYY